MLRFNYEDPQTFEESMIALDHLVGDSSIEVSERSVIKLSEAYDRHVSELKGSLEQDDSSLAELDQSWEDPLPNIHRLILNSQQVEVPDTSEGV